MEKILLDKLKECYEFLNKVQSPRTTAIYLQREIKEIINEYEKQTRSPKKVRNKAAV